MLPNPDILNEFPHGKFVLSNLAAKRAKQLREGAPALVQIDSTHPLTIALAEIASGKIKAIMPTLGEGMDEAVVVEAVLPDTLTGELGMLLPALDETEASLISGDDLHHEETEEHEPEGVISLSDLVGEDDEAEVAADGEDGDLSLTDIAEQENLEEEGEGPDAAA
jgi:DNA-directed RNA polymerase subunit omega